MLDGCGRYLSAYLSFMVVALVVLVVRIMVGCCVAVEMIDLMKLVVYIGVNGSNMNSTNIL